MFIKPTLCSEQLKNRPTFMENCHLFYCESVPVKYKINFDKDDDLYLFINVDNTVFQTFFS